MAKHREKSQYEGGYFESSTGLVKFGTRYYNPSLGRWTQQDPVAGNLSDPDSLNRYLYVTDDPVNQVDPGGRYFCLLAIAMALGFLYTVFQFTWWILGLIELAADTNILLGIVLIYFFALYYVPALVFLVLDTYDWVASQCGWPSIGIEF